MTRGKRLPDVVGPCVVCGIQTVMTGRVHKKRGRQYCSPECMKKSPPGERANVACPYCGKTVSALGLANHVRGCALSPAVKSTRFCNRCQTDIGTAGWISHRQACIRSLHDFIESHSHRFALNSNTGCITMSGVGAGNRPQIGGKFVARLLLELVLGRSLLDFPHEVACHTCDNRSCVNWWHLWPGTMQDNALDMIAKGRHYTPFRKQCTTSYTDGTITP